MADGFIDPEILQVILTKRYSAPGNAVDDRYTDYIMEAAEDMVREVGGHPLEPGHIGWVGSDPTDGQAIAPRRVVTIATELAARAWGESRNLQTKAAGPVRETYFENGIRGLELTDSERETLESYSPEVSGGMWVLRIGAGRARRPRVTGNDIVAPGGEIMAGPDMGYAYGVDS